MHDIGGLEVPANRRGARQGHVVAVCSAVHQVECECEAESRHSTTWSGLGCETFDALVGRRDDVLT